MIVQLERNTQNRIIELFKNNEKLGYDYLGNWEYRGNNRNIEEEYLQKYLKSAGYSNILISRAIFELKSVANNGGESLYNRNKNVYGLLRYGVQVKEGAGENNKTVQFINWKEPEKNIFAIAEEVTITHTVEKRPDIVLYINGIAIGVIELKRSSVSIGEGIRQSITNQQKDCIEPFFSTIQFVFAGNDSEGLRYGTVGTGEKYFLTWKEDEDLDEGNLLDKYLNKLCNKKRILEIMYDFVLFDGGIKKLPRVHQYFGIKAAQENLRKREGGIIWHTQGSGKSIVMVLLAKWLLANFPNGRVAIITDRDELDKQIERVFSDAGEEIYRTSSGKDLMAQLALTTPRLLCSLVHKFRKGDGEDFDAFIEELKKGENKAVGEIFVFVDECHRTQGGKLHKIMKAMLPNAVFIGFTGTPLLKKDKQISLEVFGKYIHTYKFNEAVGDKVVLDLMYEARSIKQRLTSPKNIDIWFKTQTAKLNEFQRAELKRTWGTMQEVLSSKNRMQQIVNDLVLDFSSKPRLKSGYGNAILVAGSIYEACKYHELLEATPLKGKCAVITSYNPSHRDVTTEDTGANTQTDKQFIYEYYTKILKDVVADAGKEKSETYEDKSKALFVKEPANMKILIVVAKLLTGFDAPSCSYIYLDKEMQDHGLFQAICRVNRLDTEDKEFGYVIDYKELFPKLEDAVAVYTAELDYDKFKKDDCDVHLKDRLAAAKKRLDAAREELDEICKPVEIPKDTAAYIRYFCGNTEKPEDLQSTETRRNALYKHTIIFIRAYSNIAGELEEAGYTETEIKRIENDLKNYINLREMIRQASGETLDTKPYEADMRFLIDTFIQADPSKRIDKFENSSVLDLILRHGIDEAVNRLMRGFSGSRKAVSEAIINNIRQAIIKDNLLDPAFYGEMSKLLDAVIKEINKGRNDYKESLKKLAEIVKKIADKDSVKMPDKIDSPGKRALYNNLDKDEDLALKCHETAKTYAQHNWKEDPRKQQVLKGELYKVLNDVKKVEATFGILKEQKEY